jgi:hypothetical protein
MANFNRYAKISINGDTKLMPFRDVWIEKKQVNLLNTNGRN